VADSPNSNDGIVGEFRRHIGDTSYTYVQMEIACDDAAATKAYVEVSDTIFSTTIENGDTEDLEQDLTAPAVDTIEKLVSFITAHANYGAWVVSDGEGSHASADLEIIAPKDCLRRRVQLRSRRWSDSELEDVLNRGLIRLGRDIGETYSLTTVPSSIKDLLFILGTIGIYWDQINNATKRRGVDLRPEDFRVLHQALMDEYNQTLIALKASRPAPVPTLSNEELETLGAGEIIVGTQYRRNLRTGRITPSAVSPFPIASQIVATFIGGAKIQLNWARSRTVNFSQYQIWRGTTQAVSNISEVVRPSGSVTATGTKILTEYNPERTVWVDGGSSPLPPGTYYYRMYVFNHNGEWAASEVVSATVI
jgi:hypothetical protein